MKASPLEFRFRFLILAIILVLGFVAPWNYALHLDTIRTWQLLAAWVAHDLGHVAQAARAMAKQYREAVGPWRAYLPILDR